MKKRHSCRSRRLDRFLLGTLLSWFILNGGMMGKIVGIILFFMTLERGMAMGNEVSILKCSGSSCTLSYADHRNQAIVVPENVADVNIRHSGSGILSVSGSVEKLDVYYTGSGKLMLKELAANNVVLVHSGSGAVFLRADKNIEIKGAGSGGVHLYGDGKLENHRTGSGAFLRND
ncbi:GIN domain-containing protein [Rugamonas sp. DEMB1]|uniref:GIN domain-containing protein n=1 Tax=Rugamonas sp. DEMB1 TaxID=3039386 RepID=UPI002448C17B|nr:DUF2807 domain-containing protein [Rugamonas sp. DEMB1]WGG52464.1 DUF2807 domain-containing protein [Rugamonas sp. DEMB1]